MAGLVEDSRVLILASLLNLLWYVLAEVSEENKASHRHVVGKAKSVSTAFLDHCGFLL